MARRKKRNTDDSGSGQPASAGMGCGATGRAPGLDATVALGTGLSPVLRKPRGRKPVSAQSLSKIGRKASAVPVGDGMGGVAGHLAVGTRRSNYAALKKQTDRANHAAKLAAAGKSPPTAQTLSDSAQLRVAEMFSVRPPLSLIARVAPVVANVRGDLVNLHADLVAGKYSAEDDRDGLEEIALHLGRLQAALIDLPRMRRERSMRQFMGAV